MRILQVLGTSDGGVAAHVRQVVPLLARRGHGIIVASPAPLTAPADDEVAHGDDDDHVTWAHVPIGRRPGRADLPAVRRLQTLIKGADLVHAHGLRAGALAALALPRPTTSVGPRLVVTLHNRAVGARSTRVFARGLLHIVARRSAAVLCVSPDLADLARRAGAREVRVAIVPVPPAVRAEIAAAQAGEREPLAEVPVIVTIARLAPQKGLDLLCETAELLQDRCAAGSLPRFEWWIAGEGPLREEIAARIEAAGLPVRLLGRRADVAELLARCDVVVSSAEWEGQPIGLQEALLAGCAIVATDVGGTRHTLGAGATLVPREAGRLAAAIAPLLSDAAALTEARDQAARHAPLLPGETELLAQLEAVYEP